MARITINDVAREAKVSTMTVSRVINNKGEISPLTRERVEGVIARLGYRPSAVARSLSSNRTQTLGLVVPDITNPFFPEIVRGAEDTAWARDYTIMLCSTVENLEREEETLRILEDKQVDGIILCSARLPDDKLLPLIKRYPAAVLFNRPALDSVSASLQVDDTYGAMRAVHHLLAAGRRHLALLSGPPHSYSGRGRVKGFSLALEATGHPHDGVLCHPCAPTEAGGYEAARVLLSTHPQVDGLFCYNDLVAIGALRACAELGLRVPEDLAIIGCDDIRFSNLVKPSLTTLSVSKYDLGQRAVEMLFTRIDGGEQGEIVVKPKLIVRESAP